MKITSDVCKQKIVEYVKNNKALIEKEFCLRTKEERKSFEEAYKKSCSPSNWKRFSKEKSSPYSDFNGIERGFDCVPFDDQLRAYVITDPSDSQILSLLVQGE